MPAVATGMRYLGAWSSTTSYSLQHVVTLGGVSYVATAASLNHAPPNATYWAPLEAGPAYDVIANAPTSGADRMLWVATDEGLLQMQGGVLRNVGPQQSDIQALQSQITALGAPLAPSTANAVLAVNNGATAWVEQLLLDANVDPAAGIRAAKLYGAQTISAAATVTAASAGVVLVDTTSAAFTITLPATPTTGSIFLFIDKTGQWATHNLTIGRNAKLIDGAAANLVLTTAYAAVGLYYDGTGWHTIWTTIGSGGGSGTPPRTIGSALWYGPIGGTGTMVPATAKLYAVPLDLPSATTITKIGVEITSAGTTGAVIRLGVYSDVAGKPAVLLSDAGTIDGTVLFSTTPGQITGLSIAVPGTRIWLAAVVQGAPTTAPTVRSVNTNQPLVGSVNQQGSNNQAGFIQPGAATTGALGNPFPTGSDSSTSAPRVMVST